MNGSHIAGGGLGAILAVILSALGKKIGLTLTDSEAAGGALALLGVGVGVGHAFHELYKAGIVPTFRQLLFGAKPTTK